MELRLVCLGALSTLDPSFFSGSYLVCSVWLHFYINILLSPQNLFLAFHFQCSAFTKTKYSCNFYWRLPPWAPAVLLYCWWFSEGQDFMGCYFLRPPVWQKYPVILTTVWPQLQWHLPPFPWSLDEEHPPPRPRPPCRISGKDSLSRKGHVKKKMGSQESPGWAVFHSTSHPSACPISPCMPSMFSYAMVTPKKE